jgi:3'(2'), 5'-bisphosphate nucleotidase
MQPDEHLAKSVVEIAVAAGAAILDVYARGAVSQTAKPDASPLTEADLRAHRVIVDRLARIEPRYPVLSEESCDVPLAERASWRTFWLVDPLDGTKEFISRNGEFTVNIALVAHGKPILGVVHVPVERATYWGYGSAAQRTGAWRIEERGETRALSVAAHAADRPRVLASRSHRGDSLDRFLAKLGPCDLVSAGSALKFCRLAEGVADVYPRLGPTSQWDTAAGHALVEGAGGCVVAADGRDLLYDQRSDFLNPSFIAYGDASRDWLALI